MEAAPEPQGDSPEVAHRIAQVMAYGRLSGAPLAPKLELVAKVRKEAEQQNPQES